MKPIDIGDLTAATGVSARTLYYGFKQHRGASPKKYLKGVRLLNARRSLLEAQLRGARVAEVAAAVGYENKEPVRARLQRLFRREPERDAAWHALAPETISAAWTCLRPVQAMCNTGVICYETADFGRWRVLWRVVRTKRVEETAHEKNIGVTFICIRRGAADGGNADRIRQAPAPNYYAGKTVQMIIGFGPGGGYDLWARTVARHIGKHLPGNPNVVSQNMPGAGSFTPPPISTPPRRKTAR